MIRAQPAGGSVSSYQIRFYIGKISGAERTVALWWRSGTGGSTNIGKNVLLAVIEQSLKEQLETSVTSTTNANSQTQINYVVRQSIRLKRAGYYHIDD